MKCSHSKGIPGVDSAFCPDCRQTFLPRSPAYLEINKRQLEIPGIGPVPEFEPYPVKFLNLSHGKDVPWVGTAIAEIDGDSIKYLRINFAENGRKRQADVPICRILTSCSDYNQCQDCDVELEPGLPTKIETRDQAIARIETEIKLSLW
jgi:hypothetical protein